MNDQSPLAQTLGIMSQALRDAGAGDAPKLSLEALKTFIAQPDIPAPPAPAMLEHDDGVYFGLPEDEYHSDPAFGSSDMKKLATNPASWWFGSKFNPNREEQEQTPSQFFGTALHKCILEGRLAFEAKYAPADFPGNIKAGIEERKAIIASGKLPVKRDDWTRIQTAGATVRANPHLAEAFSNGQPEVSIFWTDTSGIRKKARIDFLKIRASVDVKTASNERDIAFPLACRAALASYRYDAQATHYHDARAAMPALVASGAVHGEHDPAWLQRVCAVEEWASVIVFIQSKGAPLVYPVSISPGNPIIEVARVLLRQAEENYREWAGRFGLDTPWVLVDPVEELMMDDLPYYFARKTP